MNHCTHERLHRVHWCDSDGAIHTAGWRCAACSIEIADTTPSPLDDDALVERTLYHLNAHETGGSFDYGSTWPDLLAAIMEGMTRGWVERAELTRPSPGGATHLAYATTGRGERALTAYRTRLRQQAQPAPSAETGESK